MGAGESWNWHVCGDIDISYTASINFLGIIIKLHVHISIKTVLAQLHQYMHIVPKYYNSD